MRIVKLINAPVLVSKVSKTLYMHVKKYEEMEYSVAVYSPLSLTVVHAAIRKKLMELKEEGIEGRVPMQMFLLPSFPSPRF